MPLPCFDANGNLPAGTYSAGIEEFYIRFVASFAETTREGIFNGYQKLLREFAHIGICTHQIIDGSYTTNKTNPGDIDLVSFLDGPKINEIAKKDADLANKLINNFFCGKKTKKIYHCDSYACPIYPQTDPKYRDSIERSIYWYDFFGHDRMKNPKGIIEIAAEELSKGADSVFDKSKYNKPPTSGNSLHLEETRRPLHEIKKELIQVNQFVYRSRKYIANDPNDFAEVISLQSMTGRELELIEEFSVALLERLAICENIDTKEIEELLSFTHIQIKKLDFTSDFFLEIDQHETIIANVRKNCLNACKILSRFYSTQNENRKNLQLLMLSIEGICVNGHRISILSFGKILSKLQRLVDTIGAKILASKRKNPHEKECLKGIQSTDLTQLDFAFNFGGSFGMALAERVTFNEQEGEENGLLFGESERLLQLTMQEIYELMDCRDNKERITTKAHSLGQEAMRAYKAFLEEIAIDKNRLFIQNVNNKQYRMIDSKVAQKTISTISEEADPNEETISVLGIVKGIDLVDKKITLKLKERKRYIKPYFNDRDNEITTTIKTSLDKLVQCTLRVETTPIEGSDKTKKAEYIMAISIQQNTQITVEEN
ncbi:hypothetical protein Dpep_0052 [Dethiosulfovibrio peptidovorans DSM 11002]|uniref:Uncharacterized protein n=1 Tax=Dethiosulfovibrio peptidovorans DSM 11002 TaxID=469381 RepID=D2Z2C8_9BACT|nr:hypothetical protein [Dethiosulfovibrio peptidovorans]EFC90084.1 hypothetical protein Dpep_0052 [Dethiosulfovibrio peptidovorans DSM 11002]